MLVTQNDNRSKFWLAEGAIRYLNLGPKLLEETVICGYTFTQRVRGNTEKAP